MEIFKLEVLATICTPKNQILASDMSISSSLSLASYMSLRIYNIKLLSFERYEKAKRTCSNLGGDVTMAVNEDLDQEVGNPSLCEAPPAWGGKQVVWLPVVLDSIEGGANQWRTDSSTTSKTPLRKDEQKWAISQPNGLGIQQCVSLWQTHNGSRVWYDVDCHDQYCSICAIPALQTYYLRGSGMGGIKFPSDIDRKYSLLMEMQRNTHKLVFEGQHGLSQISWFPIKKETLIKRYDNQEILPGQYATLQLEGNPFGFNLDNTRNIDRDWIFTNVVVFLPFTFFKKLV